MAEIVTLECPHCGRTRETPRDPTDPPATARVRTKCDRCDDGDFALVDYFDAEGRQVLPD